jgi:ferredoxin
VHVTVDRELCIGSGNCVRLAPGSFDQDEEAISFPMADEFPEDLRSLLKRAAAECPVRAITVID